jgi:hypothetical protein
VIVYSTPFVVADDGIATTPEELTVTSFPVVSLDDHVTVWLVAFEGAITALN